MSEKFPPNIFLRTGGPHLDVKDFRDGFCSFPIPYESVPAPRFHKVFYGVSKGGKFIVAVSYISTWENEPSHHSAEVFDSKERAIEWLQKYNPTEHVLGFPPTDAYAEKQRRLMIEIRQRYLNIISEFCKHLKIAQIVE